MVVIEQLLNLAWVALAIGSFARLLTHRRGPRALMALAFTMALLFPIISVSDDFNADRTVNDAALLIPLLAVIAALVAIALIETLPRTHRVVILAVQSDPRSPPRR